MEDTTMHSQEYYNQSEMKIILEYIIDWETIINDKKIFEDSNITFATFQNEFLFSNFLDSFGDSKILIWDSSKSDNSLLFRCSILSFCYNFKKAVEKLKNGQSQESYSFGSEEGEYFFKIALVNETLSINSRGKEFTYEFTPFANALNQFVDKVLFELPIYYEGLASSKYFLKIQKEL